MNRAQTTAINNPCFEVADHDNAALSRYTAYGAFKLKNTVKIAGYFGIECWVASITVINPDAGSFSNNLLDEIKDQLQAMLHGVGTSEKKFHVEEGEFMLFSPLTENEKKKMPKPDFARILNPIITEMRGYAYRHPNPGFLAVTNPKLCRGVFIGGFVFKMILTANLERNERHWTASCSVCPSEDSSPMKYFETPQLVGEMRLEIAMMMLDGIGQGDLGMYEPDERSTIAMLMKDMTAAEIARFPKNIKTDNSLLEMLVTGAGLRAH